MGFKVVSEDLSAHASHLDGLVDRLKTAVSAAETASMSDDSFGLLCAFLPSMINPVEEQGLDALRAAVEGVSATADNVRGVARDYSEVDTDGSDRFGRILREPTPSLPKMEATERTARRSVDV